jgi:hypothetical protein
MYTSSYYVLSEELGDTKVDIMYDRLCQKFEFTNDSTNSHELCLKFILKEKY